MDTASTGGKMNNEELENESAEHEMEMTAGVEDAASEMEDEDTDDESEDVEDSGEDADADDDLASDMES